MQSLGCLLLQFRPKSVTLHIAGEPRIKEGETESACQQYDPDDAGTESAIVFATELPWTLIISVPWDLAKQM